MFYKIYYDFLFNDTKEILLFSSRVKICTTLK